MILNDERANFAGSREVLPPSSIKDILNLFSGGIAMWEVRYTAEVEEFLDHLYEHDGRSHQLVGQAIEVLADRGPMLGRPLVDRISGAVLANMKELRPPSGGRSEVRILFCFDPWRSAILLVAGDKSGQWRRWYEKAIPRAEGLFEHYLVDRRKEASDD